MKPGDPKRRWLLFMILFPSLASNAGAGLPAMMTSTVPPVIVACPDGSVVSTIVTRDIANNPLPGVPTSLVFTACGTFHACATACTGCSLASDSSSVSLAADAHGVSVFGVRGVMTGCTSPGSLLVLSDGFPIGWSRFASLDQDGDQAVTLADVAVVHARLGTAETASDFDGDGVVTPADEAMVAAHVGATCFRATPAGSTTWGRLKSAYR